MAAGESPGAKPDFTILFLLLFLTLFIAYQFQMVRLPVKRLHVYYLLN